MQTADMGLHAHGWRFWEHDHGYQKGFILCIGHIRSFPIRVVCLSVWLMQKDCTCGIGSNLRLLIAPLWLPMITSFDWHDYTAPIGYTWIHTWWKWPCATPCFGQTQPGSTGTASNITCLIDSPYTRLDTVTAPTNAPRRKRLSSF